MTPAALPDLAAQPEPLAVRIKYGLDRVGAIILIPLLSPLLAVIALAIVLDDGRPIFHRQQRPGLGGRPFLVWKFRTMLTHADQFLDDRGRVVGGNRITRVGRVLRRLSLDELPQLFNIALGEMSFIGPRPAALEHLARYTPAQLGRFAMRPGVTGLAQVNGRNTLKWSERIAYDLEYIARYSPWLDFRILLRTCRVVTLGDGLVMDRNPQEVDDLTPVSRPGRDD